MRAALLLLALSSSASPALAGPCGYGLTCGDPNRTNPPCPPSDVAEFALVAPLLDQCDAATKYFNAGVWETADKSKFCTLASPCGTLVPYVLNNDPYSRICGDYGRFYNVIYMLRGYCRGEEVANLPGDNGLLASLKQQSQSTTAPPPPPATTAPSTSTPPPTAARTTPPPTTSAPATPEPTATPPTTTMVPTPTANETASASGSSDTSEDDTAIVSPDEATSVSPAPVPSSTKPTTSIAARFVASSISMTVVVILGWLS